MGERGSRGTFRVILGVIHVWLVASSRLSSSFRSQVTRSAVIEISSDDGASRRFALDGETRMASAGRGRDGKPDCALRFRSAKLAVSVLSSKQAPALMLNGLGDGTIRLEGNPALFGWFQGLLRAPLASRVAPTALPHPYLAPDRSAPHASMITIEPATTALDPGWTGAVKAREQLAIWRVANGERVPRG